MPTPQITPPAGGSKITIANGKLRVPENPIMPFIEGDGTGPDIWRASVRVLDAAVRKAYSGKREIKWMEVYAGEKAFKLFNTWLPDESVDAFREYLVGIKGPLTTPVGGGIRSLNVALRQILDLYVCLRPVRWFKGVPSPVKYPEKVDMVIYMTGHAVFEATHGTAPKYANLDKVNPGSVILSGEMMLRYMGWTEAADLIIRGMDGVIAAKTVTYDFARLMEGATEVKTSQFGDAVIAHM